MKFKDLLKTSGFAAVSAALALTALPMEAAARDNDRNGGAWGNRSNNAARTVERRSEAPRVERQIQNRAPRAEGNGERRMPQFQNRQVQDRQVQNRRIENRQIQNRTGNTPAWTQRSGDRSAAQVNRGSEARSGQNGWNARRSGDWNRDRSDANRQAARTDTARTGQGQTGWQNSWNNNRQVDSQRRNGSYSDRNRNTAYRDNDRNRGYNNDRNWNRNNDRNWNRDNNRNWNRDNNRNWNRDRNNYRSADRNYGKWDRRWRDNNRYNWSDYRRSNRNVYRLGAYYSPYRNYSYSRLSIGFFMDSLFYSSRYWINDPYYYRLPPAYGSYRWIRYYDDALLVDIYSGEVVDVIYDFFW